MNKHLVIGLYEDNGQRCADSYETSHPELAEALFEAQYPGVIVAGVVTSTGEMQVVS